MTLKDLNELVIITINNLKDHGVFPKENNHFDFKLELNFFGLTNPIEIFCKNFAKDILSFSNAHGGIIMLGIKDENGELTEIGLNENNLNLLSKIDLNLIAQKFEKITNVGVNIDLQLFQLGTRKFYYLLIEKQSQVLIPINEFVEYNLNKGEIIYRLSSKNKIANHSAQDFNNFLQMKSNEKNKEFMEIWSKVLPQMFDINPKEILIINPTNNKIYGFNGKDRILSSSEIEIDKTDQGVFNIILNAISAGEIGKISDDEGKPLYKIVGQVKSGAPREHISTTTLLTEIRKVAKYRISSVQLKILFKYLGWVDNENFSVENPSKDPTNSEYSEFIWLENFDKIKKSHKVVCSDKAIEKLVEIIDNKDLHMSIFSRNLKKNT
ncbi:MAG TPA: ATP-binding protein [Pedobacter sp.]|nr:ATP-binding protein [Pedobacter sp.]